MHVMLVASAWLKNNMPNSNTVALAGSSGLFTWLLTHLLQAGTLENCAPLISSAVAANRDFCECPGGLESPQSPAEVGSLVVQLGTLAIGWISENSTQFWVGILVGFCLAPVIDVLFYLKQLWQNFITRQLRNLSRPSTGQHVYALR